MSNIMPTITELSVDEIQMGDRLRPVSQAGVDALKASIEELGVMKDKIHVRKIKRSGNYVLMVGGHRLTAARELGWETIPVVCWDCNDSFARLMEIDDNLAGAELTALDTAVFLAERKDVYERLHPETIATAGAELAAKRWNDATDIVSTASFATATAEKFGISDRQVRRLVAAGSVLRGRNANDLRNAPNPVTLKDLTEIAKIGEVSERDRVVALLSNGDVKNASEARRKYQSELGNGPTPLNNTDATFARLLDAWRRAPKAARKMFLETEGDEVSAVLAELKGSSE